MKPPARPLTIAFLLTSLLLASPSPPASTQERGVDLRPSQAGASGYYALVIGNNVYTSLPRLKTAEADARAVAAILQKSYGFETNLILNATRARIVSALAAYRHRLGPEARLLIYYAGHGYNDRDANKAYWLPVDASTDDPVNWIIADEITSAIRVVPARHVLVVSDSCYSGTLTRGIGEPMPLAADRERFLQRMGAGRSRMLMASGGNEPVADGGGGEHSVFAGALLRGLREMDREKFTAAELFRYYVEERVAGRAEQLPEYNPLRNSGHESGDFVFVKVITGGKRAEASDKAPPAALDPMAFELEYWNAIKNSSDPEEYRDYLKRYPEGRFAEIARRRVKNGADGNTSSGAAAATGKPTTPTNARPLLYGLVVDNSASSTPHLNKVIEAGKKIVSKNRAHDEAFVVQFVDSNHIRIMQDFTADTIALSDALEDMRPERGQAAVVDATYLSAEHVAMRKMMDAGREHRRALILITNGDDHSFYKKEQLLSAMLEFGVKVYAIGIVNELDKSKQRDKAKQLLTEITEKTGGRVYFPNSLADLPRIVDELMRELQDK